MSYTLRETVEFKSLKYMFCSVPLYTSDSQMHSLTNSEDQDEMSHNATFHPGLHCSLRPKRSSETEIQFLYETI